MGNINDTIEKVEVVILDDCHKIIEQLIKEYWEYDSNYIFKNLPSQIKKKYVELEINIQDTVAKFSYIELHLYCDYCKTVQHKSYFSQTPFKNRIYYFKRLERREMEFKCNQCQIRESEQVKQQITLEHKALADKEYIRMVDISEKLNKAYEEKRWNDLSLFLNIVLKNAIVLNNMKELMNYYYGMGSQYYKMLFPALRLLEAENLVYLTYDSENQSIILDYYILDKLRENYFYQPKKQLL